MPPQAQGGPNQVQTGFIQSQAHQTQPNASNTNNPMNKMANSNSNEWSSGNQALFGNNSNRVINSYFIETNNLDLDKKFLFLFTVFFIYFLIFYFLNVSRLNVLLLFRKFINNNIL